MPTPIVSKGSTTWNGDLFSGSGRTSLDTSGLGTFDVTWKARAEESGGGTTSPEELIAAAHATCFAQQFSLELAQNGTPPAELRSSAEATFVAGEGITGIHLTVEGQVDGISAEDFQRIADSASTGCPVSQALKGTKITLTASLA
ncbi:OsmC family peroxiredoxin [Georgenia yuyongxinii]|uniref:OsmC family peroxiredoxin n=1 Tax=Georgenia yuyongxinii TaxID=2589797 RepID=A0A552WMN6_9MICO|nr:OsmC family peroxiredoxin [Georgenia yuyongxinii]TRW44012.1 OsmC family peroxiredoxin [Georgenia yuyongxinii]